MGQRLVVQIEDNGEPLANAYYHWSGYTGSSIDMVNQILEYFDDQPDDLCDDPNTTFAMKGAVGTKCLAVWLLYMTGARFNLDETARLESERLKEQYEYCFDGKTVDRNDGLLCITREGMEKNLGWSEGTVYIDLSTKEIDFGCICEETVEMWQSYRRDEGENDDPLCLPVLNVPHLTFYNWFDFADGVQELISNRQYCAIDSNGETVYMFIE